MAKRKQQRAGAVLRPRDARTFKAICELPRDNHAWGRFHLGFNHEGEIYMGEQRAGKTPVWSGTMPRHVFERLIDWYNGADRRQEGE